MYSLKLIDSLIQKHNLCGKSLRLGGIIGGSAIFLLCSIMYLGMSIYSDSNRQKMVYVDVDKVITNVTERILAISDLDKADKQLQEYRAAFDVALDNYSKEHNVIIFSSPRPIRGVEDKTNELIKRAFGGEGVDKRERIDDSK